MKIENGIKYIIVSIITFAALPVGLTLIPGKSRADLVDDCVTLRWQNNATCGLGGPSDPLKNGRNNWASAMSNNGANVNANDITLFYSEFADGEFGTGGEDHINNNIDTADAVFIGTHGNCMWSPPTDECGDDNNCICVNPIFMLTTTSGSPRANDCWVRISEMDLGDDVANIADFLACHSAERTAAYMILVHTHYLHQWHGYYGTSNGNSSKTSGEMDEYVEDAFDGAASYAWIENAVGWDCWTDSTKDCCPISMVRGNSENDADYRLENEDYHDNMTHPYGSYLISHYYGSCDPPHPNGPGPMRDHFGF